MGGGVRIPVIERQEYTVFYEGLSYPEGVLVFVHCDIKQAWSKTVKQSFKTDFDNLIRMRQQPLYCLRHDTKQEKFIKMFGFEFSFSIQDYNLDVYILEV